MKNLFIWATMICCTVQLCSQNYEFKVDDISAKLSAYNNILEVIIPDPFISVESPVGIIYQHTTAGNGFSNLSEDVLRISDYPVGFQFTINPPQFSELTKNQFSFFQPTFERRGNWGQRASTNFYDLQTYGDIYTIDATDRKMTNVTFTTDQGKIELNNYVPAIPTTGIIGFDGGGNIGFSMVSDRSLKENIVEESNILSKVLKIKLKSYNYLGATQRSRGFIAQEVEEVFPELVGEINGKKTVNYLGFSTLAIQAIHEQQEIIEDLTERIEKLEKKRN